MMKSIPTGRAPAVVLVAAVALINQAGRVLMQRRRPDAEHGGLWEFPGGKIEPGEGPSAAAAREMNEELGLDIAEDALHPLGFAEGPRGPPGSGGHLVILLYICRRWHGEPQACDAAEIGWYPPDAIASLAMPPLDYPLAAALRGWLAAGN